MRQIMCNECGFLMMKNKGSRIVANICNNKLITGKYPERDRIVKDPWKGLPLPICPIAKSEDGVLQYLEIMDRVGFCQVVEGGEMKERRFDSPIEIDKEEKKYLNRRAREMGKALDRLIEAQLKRLIPKDKGKKLRKNI